MPMKYYAKLLWLGEYTIIAGSNALATPFHRYGGRWRMRREVAERKDHRNALAGFSSYLEQLGRRGELLASIDRRLLQNDIEEGLRFDSDIPVGYGLGSSGALCAAVYESYCTRPIGRGELTRLTELKLQLAQLENFFHSASSGTDPLICYLNQPVVLSAGGKIETLTLPTLPAGGDYRFFLLDTGISRQTGPLVRSFLENCRDNKAFYSRLRSELLPQTDAAIQAFIAGDWGELFDRWSQISAFQRIYFKQMIPEKFLEVWDAGLNADLYHLKLCGAGGGGFLLGFAGDYNRSLPVLKKHGVETFPLPI